MPMPPVVVVLEVADHHAGLESSSVVQWLRLRHSARSRRLNGSM
jgi:hypothetical protein